MKNVVFQFRITENTSVLTATEMRKHLAKFFIQNLDGLAEKKHKFLQQVGATKLRFNLPIHPKGSNSPRTKTLRIASEQKAKLHEVAGVLGMTQQSTFDFIMHHAVDESGKMIIDFRILVDEECKPEIFQPCLLNRFGR